MSQLNPSQQTPPNQGPTRRPDDPGELDRFKDSISLINYATQQHGYTIAEENPGRGTAKLKKEGETLLITRDRNSQHDLYWNPNDGQDNGSIIDFVKSREGASLGQVRQTLRKYLGDDGPARDAANAAQMPRPVPSKTAPPPEGLNPEQVKNYYLAEALGVSPKLESRDYLHSRGITDTTIDNPAFTGRVFTATNGPYKNTAFPLYNEGGMTNVEQKNTSMGADKAGNLIKSRFLSTPKDGIWVSKPSEGKDVPVERVVIVESGLDALSKHQLDASRGPVPNTIYIATAGNVTERQTSLIQLQIDKHQPGQVVLGDDNDAAGRRFNINYLNNLQKPRTAAFTESQVVAGGLTEYEQTAPANTFHATAQGKYNTNLRIELNHGSSAEGRGLREGLALRVAELNGGDAHKDHPPLRLETLRQSSQQSVMVVSAANADTPALELLARELHRTREQQLPAAERQPESFIRIEYAQAKDWTRDVELRAQGLTPEQVQAQAALELQARAEQQQAQQRAAELALQQGQEKVAAEAAAAQLQVQRDEEEKKRVLAEQQERDRLANEPAEIERRKQEDRALATLMLGGAALEVAAGQGALLGAGALINAVEHSHAQHHQLELSVAGTGPEQRERLEQFARVFEAHGVNLEPVSSADGQTRLVANYRLDQAELPAIHAAIEVLQRNGPDLQPPLQVYQDPEQQQARETVVTEREAQKERPGFQRQGYRAEESEGRAAPQLATDPVTTEFPDEAAKPVSGRLIISGAPGVEMDERGNPQTSYAGKVEQLLEARGATVSLGPAQMEESTGLTHQALNYSYRMDDPRQAVLSRTLDALAQETGVRLQEPETTVAVRQQQAAAVEAGPDALSLPERNRAMNEASVVVFDTQPEYGLAESLRRDGATVTPVPSADERTTGEALRVTYPVDQPEVTRAVALRLEVLATGSALEREEGQKPTGGILVENGTEAQYRQHVAAAELTREGGAREQSPAAAVEATPAAKSPELGALEQTVAGILIVREPQGPSNGDYAEKIRAALEEKGATLPPLPEKTSLESAGGFTDHRVAFSFRADAPEAAEVMKLVNALDREPGVQVKRDISHSEGQVARSKAGLGDVWDEVNNAHTAQARAQDLPQREVSPDVRVLTFTKWRDPAALEVLHTELAAAGVTVSPITSPKPAIEEVGPDHTFTATLRLGERETVAAFNRIVEPAIVTRPAEDQISLGLNGDSPAAKAERLAAGEGKWVDSMESDKRMVRGAIRVNEAGDNPWQSEVIREKLVQLGATVGPATSVEQRDGEPPTAYAFSVAYPGGSAAAPAITAAIKEAGEQSNVVLYGDASARYSRSTFVQEGPVMDQGKAAEPAKAAERDLTPEKELARASVQTSGVGALPTDNTESPSRPKERPLTEQEERDLRDKRGDGTLAYKSGFMLGDFIAAIAKNNASQEQEKVGPAPTGERSISFSASGEDHQQVISEASKRLEAQGLRIGQVDASDPAKTTVTALYKLDQPSLPYVHQGLLDEQAAGKVQLHQAPGVQDEREKEARRIAMAHFYGLTPEGPALVDGQPNLAPAFVAANQLRAEHKLPTVQEDAQRQQAERAGIAQAAGSDSAKEAAGISAHLEHEANLRQAQLDSIYAPSARARERAVEALEQAQRVPAGAQVVVEGPGTDAPLLRAPEPTLLTSLKPELESSHRYLQVMVPGEENSDRAETLRQGFASAGATVSPVDVQSGAAIFAVGYHVQQPELKAIDQKIRETAGEGAELSQFAYLAFERQRQIGKQVADGVAGPGEPQPPLPAERTAPVAEKQPEQQPAVVIGPVPAAPNAPEAKPPRTGLETEQGQQAADQLAAHAAGGSQSAIIKVVEPLSRGESQAPELANKIHDTVEAAGAKVGEVKSSVVGDKRVSEMEVSYRTDDAKIKDISNVLDRASHTGGVEVEERDDYKAGRTAAAAEISKKDRGQEAPARTAAKEIGD